MSDKWPIKQQSEHSLLGRNDVCYLTEVSVFRIDLFPLYLGQKTIFLVKRALKTSHLRPFTNLILCIAGKEFVFFTFP
jgi:hypothetical protein